MMVLWSVLHNLAFANNIQQVVVFADRAEITRSSQATCSNGLAEVAFSGLPITTDIRTIRADSQKGTSVVGVRQEQRVSDQEVNQRVGKLLDQRDALLLQIRKLTDEQTVQQQKMQDIQAYESIFYGAMQEELRNNKDKRSQWTQGLDKFSATRTDVQKQLGEINLQLQKLRREQSLVDKQINRLQITPSTQNIHAFVTVNCANASVAQVELNYVVPGATWFPEYDMYFDTTSPKTKVNLMVSAQIRQSTGEDWDNAKIILSTAKPNLGSQSPYPAPIHVDGNLSTEDKVLVQQTEDRSSLSNAGVVSGAVASASIEDGGQSFQLILPHKITIASNGQNHWVPIDETSTVGDESFVGVPRILSSVIDTISFTNPAPYPLLAGTLHIHKNGTYMGEHSHAYTASGEKMEISLQTLPEITVERITLTDKRTSKLIGKKQQLQRAYSVSVQNNSNKAKQVQIREAIPVSKNEDIQVILDTVATTGSYNFDQYKGFLTWEITLAPKEKKTVEVVYQIEVPSDWQMQ